MRRGGMATIWACMLVMLATQAAYADLAITKVGVTVAPKKANEDAWDRGLGKEPDPAIEIFVDGTRVERCPAVDDRFEADCAVAKGRTFAGDVEIELRVVDQDIASDDRVGYARGQIPEDFHGRFTLAVDGQLTAAWVEIEDAAGPTVMERIKRHVGARSLGGVVGLLLALLLYRLYGARLLSPPDERRAAKRTGDAGDTGEDEPRERVHVQFWRSPILLASAAASIIGIVLANVLRDPGVPLAIGSLPYVLGGFGFMAPIIDAYKQQHLGNKRLRLVIAGVAAMFAVPLYDFVSDFFTAISFLAKHAGWTFVAILLLLCLL